MIRPLNRSLMARLVGHFLLLSLLIVALAGFLAFIQARSALEDSVFDRLNVLAALGQEQLRRWVYEERQDVVFVAALPELRARSESLLRGPASEEDEAALRELLASAVKHDSHFSEILLLSARGGKIVLCTDRAHEGEYRVRDSFFTEGLHDTFVQNVYPSPSTFIPTWTVSTPLRNRRGETLGVLAVHLNLEELNRVLEMRAGLGRGGEIYLVDRYNAFVSGTRFGRESFPRGVRSAGIDAAVGGADGAGLYPNYEERPVIGVYRWIEDLELALLVEIGQQEAFAPARRMALLISSAGLVMALAFAGGTFLLARQIARPILQMTRAAVRVREGDLNATAPISTADEIGVLGRAFNEMTERLSELYEDLRLEIAERQRTQEELETKNAELERFAYTVSHDLKSPLVTINGFLGFLEQDLDSDNRGRVGIDVERIRGAVGIMSRLLNELLELSRIGRLVHPPENVDLVELVSEVREILAGSIAERRVEVVIAPDLGVVRVDRLRILEVYQNLMENAVKFLGDQAEPRVEVGRRERAGCEAVFFVRDNGAGIEPRYHDKVFGLFERLQDSVKGTGVGLALVKRIVEVHGGRIWIESEGLGSGSTFCWTLSGDGRPDAR